jgi:hypothetical protein
MIPSASRLARVRTFILGWLAVWMLAVPLVHVHPEADHHHGIAGHTHGGTLHTVFSPDLECEYAAHAHHPTPSETVHPYLQGHAQPGHVLNHPEIAFTLLKEPLDRSVDKPVDAAPAPPEPERSPLHGSSSAASPPPATTPTVAFLSTGLPLRAPPFSSL